MSTKRKIEIEYSDASNLMYKLKDELQKLGLLETFLTEVVKYQGKETLRRIGEKVEERLEEIERLSLSGWSEDELKAFINDQCTSTQREIIKLIIEGDGLFNRGKLMEKLGLKPMKMAGNMAALTRLAKGLGKEPLIVAEWKRASEGTDWEQFYRISKDKYIEFLRKEFR